MHVIGSSLRMNIRTSFTAWARREQRHTRHDVDKAGTRRTWLRIGTVTWRSSYCAVGDSPGGRSARLPAAGRPENSYKIL